jgi:hypothetical protein
MIRCVSIVVTIDTDKYKIKDTAENATDLVLDMVDGLLEFPDVVTVSCQDVTNVRVSTITS